MQSHIVRRVVASGGTLVMLLALCAAAEAQPSVSSTSGPRDTVVDGFACAWHGEASGTTTKTVAVMRKIRAQRTHPSSVSEEPGVELFLLSGC